MNNLDQYRFQFGKKEYVPIMVGGMGVDISSQELALVASKLGGIGHISDAMSPTVTDRHYKTKFTKEKSIQYRYNIENLDKTQIKFDLENVKKAQKIYVEDTMNKKQGDGAIFVNCMEKLTMNAPNETLKARLDAAMDAGIDGITLSAGLHLSTMALVQDHPRFRDVKFGIIVSSERALKLFLKKSKRLERLPDYIIVEGPLAGGHLGFGIEDWKKHDLKTITAEVLNFLKSNDLSIPVIPAGGVFTGSDAVVYIDMGASAVQVANRFTISKECGLPTDTKQEYLKAVEDDVIVSLISPTGYPMRILKQSPALGSGIRPNCESYGYILNKSGKCAYIDAFNRELLKGEESISVEEKICLCTHMRNYKCWTCGHYVYRLKDTTNRHENGIYQLPTAEHIFKDYQYSKDHMVSLPKLEVLKESAYN